jgi:hypothetical protein
LFSAFKRRMTPKGTPDCRNSPISRRFMNLEK